MKIYTRSGDTGETGLFGGTRVPKSAARVSAYGTIDELSATIGWAVSACRSLAGGERLVERLESIQTQLFAVGGELASAPGAAADAFPYVEDAHVAQMEAWIDELTESLPPLENFILPGGGAAGSALHVARTVCRRAERELVALSAGEPVRGEVIRYGNRLSDLLFVMARAANAMDHEEETIWSPHRR